MNIHKQTEAKHSKTDKKLFAEFYKQLLEAISLGLIDGWKCTINPSDSIKIIDDIIEASEQNTGKTVFDEFKSWPKEARESLSLRLREFIERASGCWKQLPQANILYHLVFASKFGDVASDIGSDNTLTYRIRRKWLTLSSSNETLLREYSGVSACQVRDFLLLEAFRRKSFREVVFPVADFQKARGLKDRKEAKRQLKAAINDLYDVSISWDQKFIPENERKKLPKDTPISGRFRILSSEYLNKRGDVKVVFTEEFYRFVSCLAPMEYHSCLLRINCRLHPYAYSMGFRFLYRFNLQIKSKQDEIMRGTYSATLSVANLLEVSGLDKVAENVKRQSRNLLGRVIKPFERNLDALKEMGKWEYVKHNGQVQPDEPKRYDTFKELLVKFTFCDYPKSDKRIMSILSTPKLEADK